MKIFLYNLDDIKDLIFIDHTKYISIENKTKYKPKK